MISKVSIRNFKCLRDVQTGLERFTVFVGPNGSGKSSVLQGLDLLCLSFRLPQGVEEAKISEALSRGAKDGVDLAAETAGRWYRYRSRTPPQPGNPVVQQQSWTGEGRGVGPELESAGWKPWQFNQANSPPMPSSVLLRLETSRLTQSNPASPDTTVMAPDGTGLHSALAAMALNDPDAWQRLQGNLKQIIPTIRRLRHTKTVMSRPPSLLFDTVGGDSLEAHQVSEGTLLVLGLLAALHATSGPSLVLLDDLDRGLHPKAQKELISLLRGLLQTNSDLQIVATTHSPYLLDWMEPKEVRMTFLGDDGATVCAALTSHPKFSKWKDEMSPGELWSLFGEKWLIGQGAAP